MENPIAENIDGSIARRSIVIVGIFAADIFLKSNCRAFCVRNILRCKDGSGHDYDCFFEIYRHIFFLYTCNGCIYRGIDFDRIYFADVKKNTSYGFVTCRRNYDRIYLFRNHRFCSHFCG